MWSQFSGVLLILISTLTPVILSQCSYQVNNCFNKFSSDLEIHKKHQFINTDNQLNDICNRKDGIYYKFVDCVTAAEHLCASDINFKTYLCETRKLKMRINRFNWKPTFFHQLCQNISSDLSQGFIKHEECISGVFNTRKWKCDVNYDKPIKAMRDWKNNINTTCSLWRKFRDCSKSDIKQKCGSDASIISDHLFHSHQNYFEKYNSCDLEGLTDNQCWHDLLNAQTTSTQTSIISTTDRSSHSTTDMMSNNIDSNKSFDLMSSNDNTSQTGDSEMQSTFEMRLNDTNDLSDEESEPNSEETSDHSWIKLFNDSNTNDLTNNERNDYVLSENNNNESNKLETNESIETNNTNNNIERVAQTYTSVASTDSIAEKGLILIPIVLLLLIKYFF